MKSFHPNKDGHTEQPAGHSKPYPHAMRWPPLESKSMSISCEMEPCDNYKDLTDMELDWILANTTESIHCSTPINVASNIVSCTNSPSALPRREVAMPPALISPHCVMHTPNVGASVFSMVDTPTSLQSMPSPSTAYTLSSLSSRLLPSSRTFVSTEPHAISAVSPFQVETHSNSVFTNDVASLAYARHDMVGSCRSFSMLPPAFRITTSTSGGNPFSPDSDINFGHEFDHNYDEEDNDDNLASSLGNYDGIFGDNASITSFSSGPGLVEGQTSNAVAGEGNRAVPIAASTSTLADTIKREPRLRRPPQKYLPIDSEPLAQRSCRKTIKKKRHEDDTSRTRKRDEEESRDGHEIQQYELRNRQTNARIRTQRNPVQKVEKTPNSVSAVALRQKNNDVQKKKNVRRRSTSHSFGGYRQRSAASTEKNRIFAKMNRERKKKELEELRRRVAELEAENTRLYQSSKGTKHCIL